MTPVSEPENPAIPATGRRYLERMQLLRDRRLALLAVGQAVNGIGSWCAIVALWGFASFRFDAGPGAIALLGLAWALPPVLLGPVAGVPIDRLGPKRVLMIADALAAVVSLIFLLAGSFPVLVALATLHGFTSAFSEPALRSLPPRLVTDDKLVQANALLGAASQSAIVIGPVVAALSIGIIGIEGAFVIDSLTYVVGVLVLIPIAIGARTTTQSDASVALLQATFGVGLLLTTLVVTRHGRVMALDGTLNSGGSLVALPIVGLVAAAVGVQIAGVAFAVVPIAGGLVALWRVRDDEPAAPTAPPEPRELHPDPTFQPAAA